ncbi:NAD-dependent epimerase/dehydratase family protein [Demequina sp. SYSU T00039]|uniref:NAD-dependent epimerase/dehydratase family protein n=1 Tax=Demequina lignilytica TaxID=3051663 RepID=A0AAW7M3Z8_9MICO|nr:MULTISPECIES: NAD-dependent epimerase/dehydratase family protein [unclassified Demequina]MDN4477029.1 NAD-dependent epimerase/dehydratase family protein [Demequina sp. SYSU T00039-1]MDN4487202.1 NAD-dependent epimerase/dehydratase family protein [Demequina sp. SYSU T00039]
MRILIVGGTGLISSALARAAGTSGHELHLVTRGTSATAPPPPGAHSIHVDATDAVSLRNALHGMRLRGERFDAVVQFIAFDPAHVAADVETFAPLTDQYVLIATSAAYKTFDHLHPLTEDTEQENLFWEYARLKMEAEAVLREHAAAAGLGWTIVRPAHTYGPSKIPAFTANSRHPWTLVDRMRRGADIIVPGDGTSLWTLTHATDVATGILGLLGNAAALGEAVHITSDEALTWSGIYAAIARAAGLSPDRLARQTVHVPSEALMAAMPWEEGSIRGDKMHPAVYDTAKLRRLVPGWEARVPFARGVAESIAWFEADPARQTVDAAANETLDALAAIYRDALARAHHLSAMRGHEG